MRKIDIHIHTRTIQTMPRPGTGTHFCTPEEVIAKYDAIGVEKGVLLPIVNPECSLSDPQPMEEAMAIVDQYPGRFAWFMNIDPRAVSNAPDADLSCIMRYYQARGAKGVGEICANLPFDDPKVENLFRHCERGGLPVLFHISPVHGRYYGLADALGLPGLEGALRKFPGLTFLGHSQPFWAEISADLAEAERNAYPAGRITPGRLVTLLRAYPNLCADLSAGSGCNALTRDPDFGYAFLEEFQDRLFFGTDYCAPSDERPLSAWLDEAVRLGKISHEAWTKICRTNAEALLGL